LQTSSRQNAEPGSAGGESATSQEGPSRASLLCPPRAPFGLLGCAHDGGIPLVRKAALQQRSLGGRAEPAPGAGDRSQLGDERRGYDQGRLGTGERALAKGDLLPQRGAQDRAQVVGVIADPHVGVSKDVAKGDSPWQVLEGAVAGREDLVVG